MEFNVERKRKEDFKNFPIDIFVPKRPLNSLNVGEFFEYENIVYLKTYFYSELDTCPEHLKGCALCLRLDNEKPIILHGFYYVRELFLKEPLRLSEELYL